MVDAGPLTVILLCPRCHERQDVGAVIAAKLIVTEDGSALKAFMRSKDAEHRCGQLRLEDAGDPLDGDPDQPALDYAQRAAGEAVRGK